MERCQKCKIPIDYTTDSIEYNDGIYHEECYFAEKEEEKEVELNKLELMVA